ncbi:protein-L-isoaspartate(D-aspartate) O-methyltransferase [Vibrio ulleungensis]|uniref:Protein-L-isoaspartate O-methyltransferase n=1 Tax=Vibrio ulleungensis TaxID=2807619 RepID=A0ABS2HK78_9VIBR|nr:protein-L-isoaspartate(D-aspartate) O-methyltransferase [Vibrio ulleungensis]
MMPKVKRLLQQLQSMGVDAPEVLDAIATVPREQFLSQAMQHQAWDNNALPIGSGQTISQPYIVAKMTQLLDLNYSSKILEVGTGCGYQTAVLSQLVEKVHTIERIKTLQWDAKRRLKQLDVYNVAYKHGDGWQGWASKAPFDAILVTAAADVVPEVLVEQLNDGGKMIIPIGTEQQSLYLIEKSNGTVTHQMIEPVKFVPLVAGELG